MTLDRFKALEVRRKELEKEYKEPFFIDIKKEKLYMVEDDGEVTYF